MRRNKLINNFHKSNDFNQPMISNEMAPADAVVSTTRELFLFVFLQLFETKKQTTSFSEASLLEYIFPLGQLLWEK